MIAVSKVLLTKPMPDGIVPSRRMNASRHTAAGHFWVSRLRQKSSFRVAHVAYQSGDTFDRLVWLGAHHPDQARYLVRLVRFRLGEKHYQYLANVTEPQLFPLHEIARVYQRRWDIELAFWLVKQYLSLRLLWASKTEVVVPQLWAKRIISEVLQALRQEIAGQAGVSREDVSLGLLVQYALQYSAQRQDVIAMFVTQGRALGFSRREGRLRNAAPHIPPQEIGPTPADLARERPPKPAHRRGLPEPVRA